MSLRISLFLLHLLIFGILAGRSQGLECYNCDSHPGVSGVSAYPDCNKELGKLQDTNFEGRGLKATMCIKADYILGEDIKGYKKGEKRIARGGVQNGGMEGFMEGCHPFDDKDGKGIKCGCFTDRCNPGQRLTPAWIFGILVIILLA